MRNEVRREVPLEVEKKAKELKCNKGVKYVYKDGEYGPKGYPASSIGISPSHRFGNMESVNANKVYLTDEWVAFTSPSHGGVNIFTDFIPYSH